MDLFPLQGAALLHHFLHSGLGVRNDLAETDGLGSDLDQLVIVDVLDGLPRDNDNRLTLCLRLGNPFLPTGIGFDLFFDLIEIGIAPERPIKWKFLDGAFGGVNMIFHE